MGKKRSGSGRFRRVARRARRVAVGARLAVRRGRRNVAASGVKSEVVGFAAAAAASFGLGKAQAAGKTLPTVAGLMPELVYGVAAAALGTMVGATSRGTAGKAVRGAATGMLAVAAFKLGNGEPVRVGEDDDETAGFVEEDED